MSDISRENHDEPKFDVSLTEHPDGWRCTVQRGGNVTLAADGFKTEASASVWALKAVSAVLRLEIDRRFAEAVGAQSVGAQPLISLEALQAVAKSLNDKSRVRTYLESRHPQDVPCKHCGHAADEHDVYAGRCSRGCPCTVYAAVVR